MSEQSESNSFYGVFGRAVIASDRADLRFYEFAFSTEPNAKPVFNVHFYGPNFGEDAITALLTCEVEVAIFDDRAEITEVYGEKSATLRAASISADRTVYDNEDYVARVRQLDAEHTRLHVALRNALNKNHEGHKLTNELLRRAEIKAAASEDLRQRQAAAIAVLERLLGHFQKDD